MSSMDFIDDVQFSYQKLSELLLEATNPTNRDEVITNFFKNCKYEKINDFPKGLEWFNVSEPLTLAKQLKGKLVLLDFFTYCCINCMHILPDLKAIENEFSIENGLVVIGVHSAKFDNEKLSSNILSAVHRYNISHPVVNDSEAIIWNNCGINCWPSLLLLSPQGKPLILLMGEGHRDNLSLYIKNALTYFKSINEISDHSFEKKPSFHLLSESKGPLLFPGKITSYIDSENNNLDKLAISDSGNHRILITQLNGALLFTIGGEVGFKDGNLTEAKFNSPQGLIFQNEHVLYVADTDNHAVRKIDLNKRIVTTIAGTGEQGIDRVGGKIGTEQEISSPWDLALYKTPDMDMSFHHPSETIIEKDVLIIAMAGTHQIWAIFLEDTIWWKFKRYTKGTCICIAGSGREENRNNSYPQTAAFAQPSGLTLNVFKKELYIADSESSTIRRLSLVDGKVSAVVGGEKSPLDLFGYGDRDGKLCEAKLQHPLGIAMSNYPYAYVADTYNHKIKRVDVASNSIITLQWVGTGHSENLNFNEPSGLCITNDHKKIFVTDTNNHAIKVVHLSNDFHIQNVTKFLIKTNKTIQSINFDKNRFSVLKGNDLILNTNGGKIILGLKLLFGDDVKLTQDAPQKWTVISPNEHWKCIPRLGNDVNLIDTIITTQNTKEVTNFYITYNFVVCKDNKCIPKSIAVEYNVQFVENGPKEISENTSILTGLKDTIFK